MSSSSDPKLANRILRGLAFGLVAGVLTLGLGKIWPPALAWAQTVATQVLEPFGQVFLRLLFFVIIPLVFASLAAGVVPAAQAAANSALLRVERALARPTGLKSRPWYRSLIYASDVDNGYSTMSFPGVNESIRYGTEAETVAEINDLAARFGAAADAVDAARTALSTPAKR